MSLLALPQEPGGCVGQAGAHLHFIHGFRQHQRPARHTTGLGGCGRGLLRRAMRAPLPCCLRHPLAVHCCCAAVRQTPLELPAPALALCCAGNASPANRQEPLASLAPSCVPCVQACCARFPPHAKRATSLQTCRCTCTARQGWQITSSGWKGGLRGGERGGGVGRYRRMGTATRRCSPLHLAATLSSLASQAVLAPPHGSGDAGTCSGSWPPLHPSSPEAPTPCTSSPEN